MQKLLVLENLTPHIILKTRLLLQSLAADSTERFNVLSM